VHQEVLPATGRSGDGLKAYGFAVAGFFFLIFSFLIFFFPNQRLSYVFGGGFFIGVFFFVLVFKFFLVPGVVAEGGIGHAASVDDDFLRARIEAQALQV